MAGATCDAGGGCTVTCKKAPSCACIGTSDGNYCYCTCYPILASAKAEEFKKFKAGSKPTVETKVNICAHDVPIGNLAHVLDKFLPNRILVPANIAVKRVTIRSKNKTLKQIINGSGLVLKR